MFFKKKVIYQNNCVPIANVYTNINNELLENEYNRLRSFLDQNGILNACKIENEENDVKIKKMAEAGIELATKVHAYCCMILGFSEQETKQALPELTEIVAQINQDNSSFDIIYENYEKLKLKLAVVTTREKTKLADNNLAYRNNRDTEAHYGRCVIL